MTARGAPGGVVRLALAAATLPPHTTTNTYLVADRGVALLVDPGFRDPADAERVETALAGAGAPEPKAALLTHTHDDHTDGLAALRERWPDLAVYAHPAELGRVPVPGARGLAGGRRLTVGDRVVEAIHTPGHSPGHLCFHLLGESTVLAGDLVSGEGSVWVGWPEGDVAAYLDSLDAVAALAPVRLGPGHGPMPANAGQRLAEMRDHRLAREAQVLRALARPRRLSELREAIYPDLAEAARSYAEASLLAHLGKLMNERRVDHLGSDREGPYARRS